MLSWIVHIIGLGVFWLLIDTASDSTFLNTVCPLLFGVLLISLVVKIALSMGSSNGGSGGGFGGYGGDGGGFGNGGGGGDGGC